MESIGCILMIITFVLFFIYAPIAWKYDELVKKPYEQKEERKGKKEEERAEKSMDRFYSEKDVIIEMYKKGHKKEADEMKDEWWEIDSLETRAENVERWNAYMKRYHPEEE